MIFSPKFEPQATMDTNEKGTVGALDTSIPPHVCGMLLVGRDVSVRVNKGSQMRARRVHEDGLVQSDDPAVKESSIGGGRKRR